MARLFSVAIRLFCLAFTEAPVGRKRRKPGPSPHRHQQKEALLPGMLPGKLVVGILAMSLASDLPLAPLSPPTDCKPVAAGM